jgi:hypothetical protein
MEPFMKSSIGSSIEVFVNKLAVPHGKILKAISADKMIEGGSIIVLGQVQGNGFLVIPGVGQYCSNYCTGNIMPPPVTACSTNGCYEGSQLCIWTTSSRLCTSSYAYNSFGIDRCYVNCRWGCIDSDVGVAPCTNLPLNAYWTGPGTSNSMGSSNDCPWACNNGHFKNIAVCTACSARSYAVAGAGSCTPCSAGSYAALQQQQVQALAFHQCPIGSYTAAGATS